MSKSVTLAAKLPDPNKTDVNGLGEIAAKLVKDPKDRHVVIMIVDCDQVVRNTDSGATEPRIRVCEVEAVQHPDDADLVKDLLVRIRDKRLQPRRPRDQPDPLFSGTGLLLGSDREPTPDQ